MKFMACLFSRFPFSRRRESGVCIPALAVFAAFFSFLPAALFAQTYLEDLSGTWRLSTVDSAAFASVDFSDAQWKEVPMPGNLAREGVAAGSIVWLRKSFQMSPSEQNLALTLGAVYDADEVYFNGRLIGKTGSLTQASNEYARPRVYHLPAHLIQNGENLLAIRIRGSFRGEIGITGAPVEIRAVNDAWWKIWKDQARNLVFAGLYMIIGVFFIVLYFRVREYREYAWFGSFAVVFALQQFLRNEIRFAIANFFLFYKLIEQICYIALPGVYLYFFIRLFRLNLPRWIHGYTIIHAITALAMVVTMNPVIWDRILSIWFFVNLPFFAFYLYIPVKKALQEKDRDAIVVSAATGLMILATVHFFAVDRGFISGTSNFNGGVLAFNLMIAGVLIHRLIRLQKDVEERQNRLGTVNELRDRVFGYLNTLVRKPGETITALTQTIFENSSGRAEAVEQLRTEVVDLQNNLDDILELSRLEVIAEPEYVETVNFKDFITAVIPQDAITCHIKVNPEIELNTSLELVNSMVIRLIDFPGFRQFRHIDLIITSDLKQNVHLRFLMYHDDFRQTRRLFELLTSLQPDRGALWVKWAIVREIIRILTGTMNVNIINRKFLRIDITLSARLPEDHKKATVRGERIQIRYIPPGGLEAASENELTETRPVAYEKLPEFHSKMTVGEFLQALKARIRRKK